jgi:hypothetical protein
MDDMTKFTVRGMDDGCVMLFALLLCRLYWFLLPSYIILEFLVFLFEIYCTREGYGDGRER